jgi:conjugal transfer pilus assembly protein TraE
MKEEERVATARKRQLDISTERAALLGSILVSACLGFYLVTHKTVERTILVPPEISRTMWIEGDQVSAEYLEDMASFIAQLILNTTPMGVDHQGAVLKRYACSDGYGILDSLIRQSALRLKQDSATTLFSIRQMRVDRVNKKIAMQGVQSVFVGERAVGQENKTYVMALAMPAGKLCVKDFYESTAKDPLDSTPASTIAPTMPASSPKS